MEQPELDERKAAILKAIVEEYVETAQPVGSQAIALASGLGVSSATVRNEMTVLEREGYLRQPHTSAGRVPTDRGYRFFVDRYAPTGGLPPVQRRVVSDFFASAHQALEDLMHETSQLLARVSRHAAMVMAPEPDSAVVRSVQLVPLQARVVLLVAVLSNGAVEKQVLHLEQDADEGRVSAAGAALDGLLRGRPWVHLPDAAPTGDPALDEVVDTAHQALVGLAAEATSEPLYVGGVSRLAAEQEAFATNDGAARLLEMLEHQVIVVSLVRELLDRGVTVSIGSENRLDELRDCSIVVASYEAEGGAAGLVGVLGPTRMDYRHALAAVTAVSQQLGQHLSVSADFYELLGVSRSATEDDIKRAYRDLARRYHPDSGHNDPESEERFKEISRAYETLRDPERRRRYDMFGDADARATAGGEAYGFGDLFDAFFGGDPFGTRRGSGPARGADAEALLPLTLEQAAFGTTHTIEARLAVQCTRCEGAGCEPGTHPTRCDVCGGNGEVRQVRRSILGQIVTAAPCGVCAGTGQRILSQCRDCRGDGRVQASRTIDVEVPAGVDDGQRLRLTGRGPAAPRGGESGDLYVTVRVQPHPDFERHGDDLLHAHPLSVAQAALGAVLSVPTLEGASDLTVPPGTQPGQMFRVKGAGVPSLRGRGRGDLLVRVDVVVPSRLSDEEAALLHRLAELRGEEVAPPEKGVRSRLRSAFR